MAQVFEGEAADRGEHRAVAAQQLLDERGHPGGVRVGLGAHELGQLRFGEQGGDAVGDQVHGGLEAGPQDQEGERGQLVLAQPVLAVARGDHRGEQVVGRFAALALDQPDQAVRACR